MIRARGSRRRPAPRVLVASVLLLAGLTFTPAAFGGVTVTVSGTTLTADGDSAFNSIWLSCRSGNVYLHDLADSQTYPVVPPVPCAAVTSVTINGREGGRMVPPGAQTTSRP